MSKTEDSLEVLRPGKWDYVHSVSKAAVSMIPFAGGPLVELFQVVVQPPVQKRLIAWTEGVEQALRKLEEQGFDVDSLGENEAFLSVVMQATVAAVKTHEKLKLEALKNAVVNTATDQDMEDTYRHIFISFVDELTESHIVVLAWARNRPYPNPGKNPNSLRFGMSLGQLLALDVASMAGKKELCEVIWARLSGMKLVLENVPTLDCMITSVGDPNSLLSPLGQKFLRFISEARVDDQPGA